MTERLTTDGPARFVAGGSAAVHPCSTTVRPGPVFTADNLLAFARRLLPAGTPVLTTTAVAEMTKDHLTAQQRVRDGSWW